MPHRTATAIVDTTTSPHARLRPVGVADVRIEDEFWASRIGVLRETTLPSQYELIEQTGRLDNFRRAAGKISGEFKGIYFNDSDVYKWMEAVAFALAYEPDSKLKGLLHIAVGEVADAQQPDGYLNTYFMFDHEGERWTDLRHMHELYCAGHLFQAAVAHHRATGEEKLLAVARRLADHIGQVFGPDRRPGAAGHAEIEMALVELYRETRERRYLDLAQFFLDQRGHGVLGGDPYLQDHLPFREMKEIVGHAVRAAYLNAGAADILMETGDQGIAAALGHMWDNMAHKRMYVTGAIGARHQGEAFGADYELPSDTAYAETCAAIANLMWNWRMLLATGDGRFADVLELALYNGALAGLALDGRHYFYVNPLSSRGGHRRQEWFSCACCPPNIARLLAELPGYLFSSSDEGIWVHLYISAKASITLAHEGVTVQQECRPQAALVRLSLNRPCEFTLFLRIPGWASRARVRVNGRSFQADCLPGSYLAVRREWQDGDEVELELAAGPELIVAHPWVDAAGGRAAIRYGPWIFCVEQADSPEFDVWDLEVDAAAPLRAEWRGDLLGGVWMVEGQGAVSSRDAWEKALYLPLSRAPAAERRVPFRAIPYFAWANRDPGPMHVWPRLLA